MNVPNFNMKFLDANNLTITAGELFRLSNSTVVLMVSETDRGGEVTKTIHNLAVVQYSNTGYTFAFTNSATSTIVYVASSPDDIIELQE